MSWAERLKEKISHEGVGGEVSKPSKAPLGSLDTCPPTPFRGKNSVDQDAEQAAREAAEERLGILLHDAQLPRQEAERVAGLAQDYYSHLMGVGKDTGCCYAPAGRLCSEGRRLRDLYYSAAAEIR